MSESTMVEMVRSEIAHAVDEAMCEDHPDALRGILLHLGSVALTAAHRMAPSAAATESRDQIIEALTRRAEEAESKAEALGTLRAAAVAWADARRAIETSRGDRAQIRASEQYDDAIRGLLTAIVRGPAGTVQP
jgi:hypothetical protein